MWHRRKRSLRIHLEVPSSETVQIAHDDQQVGRRLYWQEPATRHVYTCQSTKHTCVNQQTHTCQSTKHIPVNQQTHTCQSTKHIPVNQQIHTCQSTNT